MLIHTADNNYIREYPIKINMYDLKMDKEQRHKNKIINEQYPETNYYNRKYHTFFADA